MMDLLDESEIPVAIFVAPRAISGGTYLLMAGHVAVMKSGSQIGSCQPVTGTGEPITETKYINYLTGLMRSHAWLHSRNETAAELFVTENLNLHAEEALRFNVIDFIAESPQDLASKLTSYVLIKYKEGEASRFILVGREEMDKYDVVRSWDFENIDKATIREFKSTIEFISIPSYLFEFPIALSMPIALLFPYIYNFFVVPILSLTVTPTIEVIIALFSLVNGAIGVGCIFLLLTKKHDQPKSS
jgi:membrane-bound ClpP family serine protease